MPWRRSVCVRHGERTPWDVLLKRDQDLIDASRSNQLPDNRDTGNHAILTDHTRDNHLPQAHPQHPKLCTRSIFSTAPPLPFSDLAPRGAHRLSARQAPAGTLGRAPLDEQQRLGVAAARNRHGRPHLARRHGAAEGGAVGRARGAGDGGARRASGGGRQHDDAGDDARLLRRRGPHRGGGGRRDLPARAARRPRARQGRGAELDPAALVRARGLAGHGEGRRRDRGRAAAGVAERCGEVAVGEGALDAARTILDGACGGRAGLGLGYADAHETREEGTGGEELHGWRGSWGVCPV